MTRLSTALDSPKAFKDYTEKDVASALTELAQKQSNGNTLTPPPYITSLKKMIKTTSSDGKICWFPSTKCMKKHFVFLSSSDENFGHLGRKMVLAGAGKEFAFHGVTFQKFLVSWSNGKVETLINSMDAAIEKFKVTKAEIKAYLKNKCQGSINGWTPRLYESTIEFDDEEKSSSSSSQAPKSSSSQVLESASSQVLESASSQVLESASSQAQCKKSSQSSELSPQRKKKKASVSSKSSESSPLASSESQKTGEIPETSATKENLNDSSLMKGKPGTIQKKEVTVLSMMETDTAVYTEVLFPKGHKFQVEVSEHYNVPVITHVPSSLQQKIGTGNIVVKVNGELALSFDLCEKMIKSVVQKKDIILTLRKNSAAPHSVIKIPFSQATRIGKIENGMCFTLFWTPCLLKDIKALRPDLLKLYVSQQESRRCEKEIRMIEEKDKKDAPEELVAKSYTAKRMYEKLSKETDGKINRLWKKRKCISL